MEIIGTILTIIFGLFLIIYPILLSYAALAFGVRQEALFLLVPIVIGLYIEYYIFTEIVHISID